MSKNRVQFQKGMSLSDFLTSYGAESQCEQALVGWRWPNGFVCPECAHTGHCVLGRGLFQCHRCRRQTSLTAGTLFAGTKLPLTKWLLAIYLLTQSKAKLVGIGCKLQHYLAEARCISACDGKSNSPITPACEPPPKPEPPPPPFPCV